MYSVQCIMYLYVRSLDKNLISECKNFSEKGSQCNCTWRFYLILPWVNPVWIVVKIVLSKKKTTWAFFYDSWPPSPCFHTFSANSVNESTPHEAVLIGDTLRRKMLMGDQLLLFLWSELSAREIIMKTLLLQ